MTNLLFFLWMMFFPLIGDDLAQWIRSKSGLPPQEYGWYETIMFLLTYYAVGILLYQK